MIPPFESEELQRLWDAKASRRDLDHLRQTVVKHAERLDEKADKADVREIRRDVQALRQAIIGGAISLCVVVLGAAVSFWFFNSPA